MRLMRNHKVWIYVRSANSNPQIAFDRMNDLIDEAAGHGFLVRGTSVDQCSGNTLKDRDGLRIMMESEHCGSRYGAGFGTDQPQQLHTAWCY